MARHFELHAEFRDDKGKGASRRLRRHGKVPAVLYGGGEDPRAITLGHQELLLQVENEAFFSNVLNIKVGDKEQAAIVKDLQKHPAKRQIMHIDFQRIVAGEKIRMTVPLHFVGEDVAPGVKQQGGVVSHLRNDVEIVCLPKDLPEYLEVDVSNMEMDEILHTSDVKLPEGVEIPELAQADALDQPVASLHRPHVAEVEPEVEEEAVEGELPEGEAPSAEAPEEPEDDKE